MRIYCDLELVTSNTRLEISRDPTGISRNIDSIPAGYMSEPENVSVITSAPQDVRRNSVVSVQIH